MLNKPGTQIKRIRQDSGMSQNRFGEKIGISGKTISAYETGRITPPLKVLERITVTYGIDVEIPNPKDKEAVIGMLGRIKNDLDLLEKNLKRSS